MEGRDLDEEGGLPAQCWAYEAAKDVAARNADGRELQQQPHRPEQCNTA